MRDTPIVSGYPYKTGPSPVNSTVSLFYSLQDHYRQKERIEDTYRDVLLLDLALGLGLGGVEDELGPLQDNVLEVDQIGCGILKISI